MKNYIILSIIWNLTDAKDTQVDIDPSLAGTKTREVSCTSVYDLSEVDSDLCDPRVRPDHAGFCNSHPCQAL